MYVCTDQTKVVFPREPGYIYHTNVVASAFFYLVNFFVLLCFELGCSTG